MGVRHWRVGGGYADDDDRFADFAVTTGVMVLNAATAFFSFFIVLRYPFHVYDISNCNIRTIQAEGECTYWPGDEP